MNVDRLVKDIKTFSDLGTKIYNDFINPEYISDEVLMVAQIWNGIEKMLPKKDKKGNWKKVNLDT